MECVVEEPHCAEGEVAQIECLMAAPPGDRGRDRARQTQLQPTKGEIARDPIERAEARERRNGLLRVGTDTPSGTRAGPAQAREGGRSHRVAVAEDRLEVPDCPEAASSDRNGVSPSVR